MESKNTSQLIIETHQSQFVLIDKSELYNLLKNSSNLQEAIQTLDSKLVPVTKYNDGLATQEDKVVLDYLAQNASGKVYVYSNQEEANQNPITRIIIADNEGLTIEKPSQDTARIGIKPFFNSAELEDGSKINATSNDKVLSFCNTETADIIIKNGRLAVDATKTKQYALAMSLVFG